MGVMLILGIVAIAAIGVPMNALFFQDGRHPAPLFSVHLPPVAKIETAQTPVAAPPAAQQLAEAPAPEAQHAPTKVDHVKSDKADLAALIDGGKPAAKNVNAKASAKTEAKAAKAEAAKAEAAHAREEKKQDAIAQLIGGGAADATDQNVLFAQRALLKLGYVVRANGVMTPATRQALAKFEQDAGIHGKSDKGDKGELSPKVLRELAAHSGLASE